MLLSLSIINNTRKIDHAMIILRIVDIFGNEILCFLIGQLNIPLVIMRYYIWKLYVNCKHQRIRVSDLKFRIYFDLLTKLDKLCIL